MDLGTEKISVLFKKYFIPTLLGMLSVSAVTAIDGIFIGHGIGSDGIAAVNICVPIFMIFTGLALMAGIGSSVIASIYLAKGKIKSARLNVTQSLLFVSIVTLIFSALMLAFQEKTAYILGSSERLLPLVKDYLIWFVLALVFEIWTAIAMFIIRLDGAPKIAMWFSIIPSVINIILDWLFIFPLGWGVGGASLATALSMMIGGILSIVYLMFYAKHLRLYPIKIGLRGFNLFLRSILSQCRIGSSALLGEATLALLLFAGNHVFMRYLGDDGVGAFGISCYYTPFVFMIGNAIAQSAQPIISFNFGLDQHIRVVKTVKIALVTALFCGTIGMLTFMIFPQFLVGLFLDTSNPAAILAIDGFPYFSTGFIFFIINLTAIGYYQSVEQVKPATIFALCRGFIFLIPAFSFMPQIFGTIGIWLSMPLSEFLTTTAIVFYYLYCRYFVIKK